MARHHAERVIPVLSALIVPLAAGWFLLSWRVMGESLGDAAGEAVGVAFGLLVVLSIVGATLRRP